MSALNVQGATPLEAWQAGASALVNSGGNQSHLFTTVEHPTVFDQAWETEFSPQRIQAGADSLRNVILTVFPYRLAARFPNRADLYAHYLEAHDRAMRRQGNRSKWGTYFERLVRFPGSGRNQLETAIGKLQTWPRNTTGLVFHLSSPAVDNPRTRGGPCWHFAEILWNPGNVLDLSVTYRNHDFFNKTLGNFVALGQLLNFIAMHSQKTPGRLYCHSVHAFAQGGIGRLRTLAQI